MNTIIPKQLRRFFLLGIHAICLDTAADESDGLDSSSSESSDDSGPSPDRNNTLLESNNSLSPAEGDILTEPECWKFILEGR